MDGCLATPGRRIGTDERYLASQVWDPADIAIMQQRLELLRRTALADEVAEDELTDEDTSYQSLNSTPLAPGWRNADSGWRPCPIGVFSAA